MVSPVVTPVVLAKTQTISQYPPAPAPVTVTPKIETQNPFSARN